MTTQLVGLTGLEPAASWSQTRRSKPTELQPDDIFQELASLS